MDKGLSGLQNLGNTCYINSVMQILSHTKELNSLLQKWKPLNPQTPESKLIKEWKSLNELMWSGNYIISPNRFINAVKEVSKKKGHSMFSGFDQNDVTEYLMFILESIHQTIARPVHITIQGTRQNDRDEFAIKCYTYIKNVYAKEYSEIYSLFYGIGITEIVDSSNSANILSQSFEHSLMLNLSIPQTSHSSCNKLTLSLNDCLDMYTTPELLDGENAWYNDRISQKQNVYKKSYFWKLPPLMIINLKRYNNNMDKDNRLVTAPLILDMSPYVHSYVRASVIYELYAICNHVGNYSSGHYFSIISTEDGKWHLFNDDNLGEVPVEHIITPYSMCFFYRQKTN